MKDIAMKKIFLKNSVITVGLIFVLLLQIACLPSQNNQKQCSQDSDCVPAVCCHSRDAVNQAYAPDCTAVLCSMQCEPETLDCGQGEIKCVNNQCTVILNSQ